MKIKPISQQATRLLAISALSLSFASQAALVGRDLDGNLATFEAYYDTDQNITWLADANYAQTSNYDADGLMTWADANAWAGGLTLGGYTDWRLADTLQPDASCGSQSGGISYGYNCTGSEMGDLFYNALGNSAGSLANTGSFSNVQSSNYWSATEYAPVTTHAWFFNFDLDFQYFSNKTNSLYGWAVHSGDVGASVVPVPAAAWLFGSALLGLLGLKRRT